MRTIPYNSVDFLRAVLIILMVLIHITYFGDLYPDIKLGILSFIMPCFLMITGALVNVDKTPRQFGRYLLGILLPYVTMVVGFALLSLHLPVRDGLKELSTEALLRVVCIDAIGPYWFLHAMMVCGTLYYVVFRLTRGKCSSATRFFLLLGVLFLVALTTPFLSLKNATYYALGVAIRLSGHRFDAHKAGTPWAIIPFALLIADKSEWDWWRLTVLICVLSFTSFVLWLYRILPSTSPLHRQLCFIGRNTLPIFLFHPIFTMMGKYAEPLFRFDPTRLLHAAFVIVFALAGGILIGRAMDATRLSRLWLRQQMIR
jgi:hypothetical protein